MTELDPEAYCGTALDVVPSEEALTLRTDWVHHSPLGTACYAFVLLEDGRMVEVVGAVVDDDSIRKREVVVRTLVADDPVGLRECESANCNR